MGSTTMMTCRCFALYILHSTRPSSTRPPSTRIDWAGWRQRGGRSRDKDKADEASRGGKGKAEGYSTMMTGRRCALYMLRSTRHCG